MDLQQLIDQARSVRGIPFQELQLPFTSLGELLARRRELTPDKTYLVFYDEDGSRSEFSYDSFARQVRDTAAFLRSSGIGLGDRVATIAHNHAQTVIQYFAAWWIGATIIPINVGEDDARMAYILTNSKTRLAFVRSEYLERVRA